MFCWMVLLDYHMFNKTIKHGGHWQAHVFSRLTLMCVSPVCSVLLAEEDSDGPAHDQRGGDCFTSSGESILYPFVSCCCLYFLIYSCLSWMWLIFVLISCVAQIFVVHLSVAPICVTYPYVAHLYEVHLYVALVYLWVIYFTCVSIICVLFMRVCHLCVIHMCLSSVCNLPVCQSLICNSPVCDYAVWEPECTVVHLCALKRAGGRTRPFLSATLC